MNYLICFESQVKGRNAMEMGLKVWVNSPNEVVLLCLTNWFVPTGGTNEYFFLDIYILDCWCSH